MSKKMLKSLYPGWSGHFLSNVPYWPCLWNAGLYDLILRNNAVWFGTIVIGAIATEYIIDEGGDAVWASFNKGVRCHCCFVAHKLALAN